METPSRITDPYLWRNLDGTVVVSTWFPDPPHVPGIYSVHNRPADEEDLMTYEFLKPEHEQEPELYFD